MLKLGYFLNKISTTCHKQVFFGVNKGNSTKKIKFDFIKHTVLLKKIGGKKMKRQTKDIRKYNAYMWQSIILRKYNTHL
jgi:hypothetical protein